MTSASEIRSPSVPVSRKIAAGVACLVVSLAVAMSGPTMAGAEVSDPFSGTANPSTATTETTTSTASTETSTSLSSKKSLVISAIVVLVLVLGGIAYAIVRDARSVAPVGEGGVGGRAASDPGAAMRRRRAKAKAARRQRKRNR